MELLHKDDIETLDKIVNACNEQRYITLNKISEVIQIPVNVKINKSEYLNRLISINIKFGVLIQKKRISRNSETNKSEVLIFLHSIDFVTKRFIEAGGFKKVYVDQLEDAKYQKVLREKTINEATITKWTKRTYWWTFGIAIFGLILATIAFIRTF